MFQKYVLDLDEYEIIKKIGKEGFGEVFLIENLNTKKQYAAKISLHNCINKIGQIFFFSKIESLFNTNYPSLLALKGFSMSNFSKEPFPTIVQDYMSNGSLHDLLNKSCQNASPIEWTDTKRYINLLGVALGMKYLHSQNIAQFDLKPQKILLDENYYPHISDFEFSGQNEEPNSCILKTLEIGTLIYMAPEILTRQPCNYKVDVYSYSLIAYQIITNKSLLDEIDCYESLIQQVSNGKRPDLSNISNRYQSDMIQRCWSTKSEERPTFAEIVSMIKDPKFYSSFELNEDEVNEYIETFSEEQPIEKTITASINTTSSVISSDVSETSLNDSEGKHQNQQEEDQENNSNDHKKPVENSKSIEFEYEYDYEYDDEKFHEIEKKMEINFAFCLHIIIIHKWENLSNSSTPKFSSDCHFPVQVFPIFATILHTKILKSERNVKPQLRNQHQINFDKCIQIFVHDITRMPTTRNEIFLTVLMVILLIRTQSQRYKLDRKRCETALKSFQQTFESMLLLILERSLDKSELFIELFSEANFNHQKLLTEFHEIFESNSISFAFGDVINNFIINRFNELLDNKLLNKIISKPDKFNFTNALKWSAFVSDLEKQNNIRLNLIHQAINVLIMIESISRTPSVVLDICPDISPALVSFFITNFKKDKNILTVPKPTKFNKEFKLNEAPKVFDFVHSKKTGLTITTVKQEFTLDNWNEFSPNDPNVKAFSFLIKYIKSNE